MNWALAIGLLSGIGMMSCGSDPLDPGAAAAGGGDGPDAGSAGSGPGGGGPSGGGGGGGMDAGSPPDPAAPLFKGDAIPEFRITLPPGSINILNTNPKVYVQGDLEVHFNSDVTLLKTIGVRLKGNYGSFRTLDQKAAFLLNFDHFTEGQELFGLEKLALNNMVQDPSMIHERLSYRLFREGGVPAPRSAYATVYVNNELYGLYSTVETVDNGDYLKKWFGDNDGSLYEGSYGSDLEPNLIGTFDHDNGMDVGYADLMDLVSALDAMTDPATFVADASKVLDLDNYVTFAATEIFIGHWDGYAWTKNNFFLYRAPDQRWSFMPWGTDQIFSEYLDPWGGGGRVEQMCGASIACRLKLKEAFDGVVKRSVDLKLIEEALDLKAFIWDAAAADPRREVSMNGIAASINATIEYLKNRPKDVTARLVCADPSAVDNDNDGSPGCGQDCDDNDPNVSPEAPEVCDLADNNCNGVWDDDPSCPQCMSVPAMGGGTLAFCFVPRSYSEAESDCLAQGGHLASIHSGAEQMDAVAGAFAVAQDQWWIGLNDLVAEGAYTWTDGTPFDYEAWAGGEPNDAGGNEECGHLAQWAGGFWNDIPCQVAMRYICRLP
jgi:hypothetical protein